MPVISRSFVTLRIRGKDVRDSWMLKIGRVISPLTISAMWNSHLLDRNVSGDIPVLFRFTMRTCHSSVSVIRFHNITSNQP
jgi:hypothetical protein